MQAFSTICVRELDRVEFSRPAEKRANHAVKLGATSFPHEPTKQAIAPPARRGVAIAEGRKHGQGRLLDGRQATRLRALLAPEHGQGASRGRKGTLRGWRGCAATIPPRRAHLWAGGSPPTAASPDRSSGDAGGAHIRFRCRS